MMTNYLSLLSVVIGLLLYIFANNLKVARVGEMTFFAGLLSFLITVVPHMPPLVTK
jgi:hypothetical protein